jgi:hypothetical protein
MKTQHIVISSMVIFLVMILNVKDLRCQEDHGMISQQYQSKSMGKINEEISEDSVNDNKNVRVLMLQMIIMRNLFYEYQETDSRELEDRLERSR